MRLKFLRWLFVYATAAFIASLIISFAFETRSTHREVKAMIENKIKEATAYSQNANETLATLKKASAEIGIKDARVIALALKSNPSIIVKGDDKATTDNLAQFGKMLEIDEIDIFNSNGICIATWPENATILGFDVRNHDGPKEFLKIIDDPSLEISQEIRETAGSIGSGKFQFSAVARLDEPGFVEIGFKAFEVEKAYQLADVSRYVSSVVGVRGFLSAFQDGVQKSGPAYAKDFPIDESPRNEIFPHTVNDEMHLVLIDEQGGYLFVGGVPTREIFSARRLTLFLLIVANFFIFFVVFILVSTLVQRLIVDSVYAVNKSLAKITNGDLGERVDVKVSKEFVELSNGVNATVDSLKQVVEEIKQRTKEELLLAKRIQAAALPNLEELFPEKDRFDVYGANHPMTSVGGDMYDFFMLDSDTALFYVADVSGHGVPASLVMMKTMALVKNLATSGYALEKVVATTNSYLSENNDSSFVTGFFCSFNLKTGVLTYVNAGHNFPFIRRGGEGFVEFEPDVNLLLGVDPDAEYVSSTTTLEPGDVFVLYTDGITEATTPYMQGCFESERALDVLNGLNRATAARQCVDSLFSAVDEFTNHADPSDDETVLVFHYVNKQ